VFNKFSYQSKPCVCSLNTRQYCKSINNLCIFQIILPWDLVTCFRVAKHKKLKTVGMGSPLSRSYSPDQEPEEHYPDLINGLFSYDLPTRRWFSMHATCPSHILLGLTTVTVHGERCQLSVSSLCRFLYPYTPFITLRSECI
jgi:hypothetical protein